MEFSREELTAILSLGIISGIIVSFADFAMLRQGHLIIETQGIIILLLGIFGMIVSVFIHEAGHKLFAGAIGYETNTEAYYPGQVIGVVLAIFSFGYITFFTPNTADLEADPIKRMHKRRKYENFMQQAYIATSGLLVTAALAILLHGAWLLTDSSLLRNLMMGNVWLLVYSLVPFELLSFYLLRFQQRIDQLPQSDGLYILHYSLVAYVTVAATSICLAVLLRFTTSLPLWIAILFGLVIGFVVWVKFFLEHV